MTIDTVAGETAGLSLFVATTGEAAPPARREIVFVDAQVQDYATIVQGISPTAEVVLIDPDRDGILQMAQMLSDRSGLDAIHVVSHGNEGVLLLGNGSLHADNMDSHSEALAGIGQSLTADGDIQLWGCEVGAGPKGQAFVVALVGATGADVAASSDTTGSGGNWKLEVRSGAVAEPAAFDAALLASYEHSLSIGAPRYVAGMLPIPDASVPSTHDSWKFGDFDNDGDIDIVTQYGGSGTPITFWQNNGNGLFTDMGTGRFPANLINLNHSAHFADFDQDGDLDLVAVRAGSPNLYEYYINLINFGSDSFWATGEAFLDTALRNAPLRKYGDFDNDGDIDIVTAAGGGITFWQNNGFGGFANMGTGRFSATGISFDSTAQFADFDNDGDLDLLARVGGTNYVLHINDGSGFFTPGPMPFANSGVTDTTGVWLHGDFDNDGDIDIVSQFGAVGTTAITFWQNDGNGAFTNMGTGLFPATGISLATSQLADFDHDGDLDLLGTGSGTSNFYYVNQGSPPRLISFTPSANGTGVGVNDSIMLTLTHDTALSKGTGLIQIRIDNGDGNYANDAVFESFAATDGRVTISGNGTASTITINPNGTFAGNTSYYVVIAPNAFLDQEGRGFVTLVDNRFHAGVPDPAQTQGSNSLAPVADRTLLSFTTADANPAPVVDANGPVAGTTNTTIFTENGPAVRIVASDAILSDDDIISGMTLTLGATPNGTDEIIVYSAALNGGFSLASQGLSGNYDAATRTYTLSGTASTDTYQNVLRAMAYSNASDAPSTAPRTVTISVTDAEGAVGQTSATINVTAVNDAPVATVPASIQMTEDTPHALTGISFSDVDAGSGNVTVTLSVPAGALAATTGSGLTIGGSASALTLTGSIADINAFLDAGHVSYTPVTNDTGTRVMTVSINDGGNTGSGGSLSDTKTVDLTITAVNDTPIATVPGSITVTEDVATALTGISFSDVDAGSGQVTVTLSVPAGSLAATSGGGVTVAGTSSALTLTGSIVAINAFIAASGVGYTTDLNATATQVLTVHITDNGNTGGPAGSDSKTVDLEVTAVNDPPAATNLDQTKGFTEDGGSVALDAIVVSDVDSGETITARLTLSNADAGTLSTGIYGAATSTYNAMTGVWTVTGSVADVNAALASISFTPAADWDQTVTIATHVEDADSDGPTDGTITLNATPVNDPPTLSGLPGAALAAVHGQAMALPEIEVADVDNATLTLTLVVSGGMLDGLTDADSATAGIQLSGTAAQINTALAAAGFTPSGTGTASIDLSLSDGTATPVTGTITLEVAPGAPSLSLVEDTGASASDGLINDPTAVLRVSLSGTGAKVGDTLTLSSGETVTLDAAAIADGHVDVTLDALADGPQSVSVTLTSGGLTGAPSPSLGFTIDATPPTTTLFGVTLSDDTGTRGDFVTNNAAQTIAATLSEALAGDETLYGSLDGGETWTNLLAFVSGTTLSWDVTLAGSGTIRLKVTDAAGNDGIVSNQAYVLDTTPPTTTLSGLALSTDSGTPGDFITNTAPQTITASLSAALAPGEILSGSLDGGHSWTNLTALVSGTTLTWTHVTLSGSGTLQLKVTDLAGNDGPVTSRTYVLDTTAPAVAITSGTLTSASKPVLTGTAEAGTTITVVIAGATFSFVATGETWTLDLASATPTFGSLALDENSANAVTVTALDAAGNVSSPATQTLIIDTTPPAVAITSPTLINTAVPLIRGTAETGATITVIVGGATYTTIATGGEWSIDLESATPTDGSLLLDLNGSNPVEVTAEDAAGNVSDPATQTLTIDTSAPGVTGVDGPSSGAYPAGTVLTFTLDLSEAVTIDSSGGTPRLVLDVGEETRYAQLTAGAGTDSLTFSYTVVAGDDDPVGLTVGTLEANGAVLTDAAGNPLDLFLPSGIPGGIVIDTSAPAQPNLMLTHDTGPNGTDGISSDGLVTVSGLEEATWFYSTDGGESWEAGSGSGFILADGTYTAGQVRVRQSDAAGNSSAVASLGAVSIDGTAPDLVMASVTGASLTLTFDEAVDAASAAGLTVRVDGAARAVTGVTGTGSTTLTLTLSEAVRHGQIVEIVYDPEAADSMLSNRAGLELGALSESVTNVTPQNMVDGVVVETTPVTLPGGTPGRVLTIPVVSGGRQEQTGNAAMADIPLVSSGGSPLLVAQVPVGFGLTVTGTEPPKSAGSSLADLIAAIQARTAFGSADQNQLTGGGGGFLQNLPGVTPLIVQTITLTGAGAPGQPLILTGTPNGPRMALVIDTSGLPGGAAIALNHIDFATIIGAGTFTGGAGSQTIWADSASQRIVLGAEDDTIHGGGGDDYVGSLGGNDWLYGDAGNDTVSGGIGNDRLWGGDGNDRLLGGSGNDRLYGDAGNDRLEGGSGRDKLYGGSGNDRLEGGSGHDRLWGGSGHDTLLGGDGNDQLRGDAGRDVLKGGLGQDRMWGGSGADTFAFDSVKESKVGSQRDVIYDFQTGLDRIDLRTIDADTTRKGNQAFSWTGSDGPFLHAHESKAFLAVGFTGKAGELRYANGILMGDVNGDGRADFQIKIIGAFAATDVLL